MGFMAPFGTLTVRQVHVERRGEHVAQHGDRQDGQEGSETHNVGDPPDLMPSTEVVGPVDKLGQWVADDRPLLEVRGAVEGNTESFGTETSDADGKEETQNEGVLGFGLNANAIGAHGRGPVAAQRGPDNADEEKYARNVADG